VTVPGDIVNAEGEKLGEHRGLVRHTIGQRRGIGIPRAEPLYVMRLDTKRNQLVVGDRSDAEAPAVDADRISFTSGIWPDSPMECSVSVRYRGRPATATIFPDDESTRRVRIEFTGDWPIAAPGQAIVFAITRSKQSNPNGNASSSAASTTRAPLTWLAMPSERSDWTT
jgi:tRNA-specific 2-thiouridylase